MEETDHGIDETILGNFSRESPCQLVRTQGAGPYFWDAAGAGETDEICYKRRIVSVFADGLVSWWEGAIGKLWRRTTVWVGN